MDKDLMFSQRNNPYCDLLTISVAKIKIFRERTKYLKRKLYFCGIILKYYYYEKDSWFGFRYHKYRMGVSE